MPASRLDAGCTLWFMEREGDLIRLATMNEEFKEKLDIINCLCNETFSISVALFDKWLKLTRNNWSTTEFGMNFAFGVLAIFFYLVWRFRIEICSCVKILRKILISSYHVIERVEGVICYLFTYLEFSAVSLFGSKCQKTRLWTLYFGIFRHSSPKNAILARTLLFILFLMYIIWAVFFLIFLI